MRGAKMREARSALLHGDIGHGLPGQIGDHVGCRRPRAPGQRDDADPARTHRKPFNVKDFQAAVSQIVHLVSEIVVRKRPKSHTNFID